MSVSEPHLHFRYNIINNTRILSMNPHFTELCFLESLFIKIRKPQLNNGIKAAKELALF